METSTNPAQPVSPASRSALPSATRWPFFGIRSARCTRCSKNHDRIVHLRIGGRNQYLVLQPEDAKHVLQENHRNYGRSPAFDILKIFLGNGLLTSDGDFWRRQRRLAQPAFHRQKLAALTQNNDFGNGPTGSMNSVTHKLTEPVNVSQAFMDVTMRHCLQNAVWFRYYWQTRRSFECTGYTQLPGQ